MDTYKRMCELLEERGLTIYEASKRSNVSRCTLTNARKRGGQLSIDTIERVCNALGIKLSEFFADREPDSGQDSIQSVSSSGSALS